MTEKGKGIFYLFRNKNLPFTGLGIKCRDSARTMKKNIKEVGFTWKNFSRKCMNVLIVKWKHFQNS